ncbi:MAG: hypothetical protein GQ570_06180 [Helicobacteraceae bacterium]|nr:hypothetical protein [Helicobacteraceae bacterium]
MANKHPNKEIDNVVKYAIANGWTIELTKGHAWARLKCPYNDGTCRNGKYCQVGIWSTPKNPTKHAQHLKKIVDGCEAEEKNEKKENENE